MYKENIGKLKIDFKRKKSISHICYGEKMGQIKTHNKWKNNIKKHFNKTESKFMANRFLRVTFF